MKKEPKQNYIFYVGSAKNVKSRIIEHWRSNTMTMCVSLKLGFDSRKWIKKFLDIYVIEAATDETIVFDYKQLEKDIREEYGSSFGK